MYRKTEGQLEFENFILPFSGKLSTENRWCKLSCLIPWEEVEQRYSKHFSSSQGAPAKSVRMALGALIIKERLGLTDEETVEQLKENPYLQCFIGLSEFSEQAPFDSSMMVHFRKRLGPEVLKELNELIVARNTRKDDDNSGGGGSGNRGKLLLDATCVPADIRYPTDLSLLNESREKLEEIIDTLHEPFIGIKDKPRTYRKKARKLYLKSAKKRRLSAKQRRKAVEKQLGFVGRNLKAVDKMLDNGSSLEVLSTREYRNLLVTREVYRQQRQMFEEKLTSVDSRIVSLSQPHVRPIVRGKAGCSTEFGAKISVSLVDRMSYVDKLSWENFSESKDLKVQVEAYKKRYGYYPESLHVDQVYRNRENRAWCKERGIRISGPALGRPPANVSLEDKRQAYEDQVIRNEIEGKFGQGKRRFGLNRLMTKLQNTSETAITLTFLVMNLERILQYLFFIVLGCLGRLQKVLGLARLRQTVC